MGIKGIEKRAVKSIDWLAEWSGLVLAPLMLLYMAIIIYEIVLRYVFNNPTFWAHESGTMIFGAQFMLAGAYCFWKGAMVNVGIFHDRFPLRVRAVVDLFLSLLPLGICLTLIWVGGDFFIVSVKQRELSYTFWGPPIYPLRGIIPVAGFLLLLQVIAKFTRDLHIAITGRSYDG